MARKTIDNRESEDLEIRNQEIEDQEVGDQEIEDLLNDIASEEIDDSEDGKNIENVVIEDEEIASAIEETKKEERALSSIKRADKKAEKSTRKKPLVKSRPYRIISRMLAIASTLILGAFLTYVVLTNAIPFKYIVALIGISAIFAVFYLFKSFRNKTSLPVLTILNILGVVLSAISILGFLKFNQLFNFLDDNLGTSDESYDIYNIIVSKSSSYENIDSVKGKEFHSISDFIDTSNLETAVKEQVNGTIVYVDGITSMLKSSIQNPTYISLLSAGTWDATVDMSGGEVYSENLKIIGEIKVKFSEKKELVSGTDVTNKSWIMYISGIDTRSGQMLDKSLSDVNILMTVNPKTKDILMVAIPRDYYVQLHGTSGLPDKLTHAGSLGGLELSMDTIEDLMGIEINQYLRVNFNAVTNLVNAIGGITVNSDVDYSFKCHTNPSCVINPGPNNLNGDCALAFSRERYAYSSGDRHRGENQEQVIEKVFDKITSNATLISKYSDILNALSGSFETSLTTSDITSLVNMQLDDMSKWTIETYNLNGNTGGAYTYSYPGQILSVMYPDQSTVNIAKAKINAVLNGEKASSVAL
ncbi:LCP family protein [Candidatus Saccharibacteria bacterium]|nr:LCP family protein [Candidatus Saccharibacteria bacterium]